jgi:large subunit ribosomal protein L33
MAQAKKSSRSKTPRIKVMLQSTGKNKLDKPTKFCYYTYRNTRNGEKLNIKKFDPRAWNEELGKFGMYCTFKEKKVPK